MEALVICEMLALSVPVGDAVAKGTCTPFVRLLVTGNPVMCRDPADSDLIVSREYSGAYRHRRGSEALSKASGVCPDSVGGGGGVYEHGVSVSALLALVEDGKDLVDGMGLRAEALLVSAEVVASAGPSPWGPPDACHPYPPAIQARAVCCARVFHQLGD